jgi:hypothetical protein
LLGCAVNAEAIDAEQKLKIEPKIEETQHMQEQ